jgi:hypothetical protein
MPHFNFFLLDEFDITLCDIAGQGKSAWYNALDCTLVSPETTAKLRWFASGFTRAVRQIISWFIAKGNVKKDAAKTLDFFDQCKSTVYQCYPW